MERELKAERAAAGRVAARARGRTGGRPRTSFDKLEKARILYEDGCSAADACKTLGIGRRTFFRHLAEMTQAEFEAKQADAANSRITENEDF
ncbi:helix-turn-helix domain-containing protein [Geobacter hydrogenophilus]|uniref:Resolvase/invertase-type recombinase catalytic domain-containing protein n=1 Tax=Geobacter hydrogenophilus TaxID=40983 RepID=A0A9W6FZ82_9BACT|nr:hypothetical protein GHYDROH2_10560 [Geobacter hydrogenophilus]